MQRALWPACKAVHGGCTRAAAAELLAHITRKIDPSLWKGDPNLAFHVAGLRAAEKDAASTVVWLDRLLKANPLFDIRRAQEDPGIEKLDDRELRDFLTPQCACQEQHGLVFNHITIANRSPFRITDVTVTISIEYSDGTRTKLIVRRLDYLEAGAEHRWNNFFKDVQLFGSNIREVDVRVDCAEKRPPFGKGRRQPAPTRMFEMVDEKPRSKKDIPEVLPAEQPPRSEEDIPEVLPADQPPRPAVCPKCGFAGRKAWRRCPKCGFVRKTSKVVTP